MPEVHPVLCLLAIWLLLNGLYVLLIAPADHRNALSRRAPDPKKADSANLEGAKEERL